VLLQWLLHFDKVPGEDYSPGNPPRAVDSA